MQDRLGRDRYERGTVVERNELHTGWQRSVCIDFVHLGLDPRDDIIGVQSAIHDHDRRDHVVLLVAAGLPEPRHITDIDVGDVLDLDRHTIRLREDNALDVFDVVTLCQVLVAAAVQKTDPADID
jgi:hypothetical protein